LISSKRKEGAAWQEQEEMQDEVQKVLVAEHVGATVVEAVAETGTQSDSPKRSNLLPR